MKSLHKIANVLLSITLLIATTGFTLNKHYCMGRLKAVAINETASPCGEKGTKDPMPCCEDVSQHLKVDEITKTAFDFDSQPDLVQLAIIAWVFSEGKLPEVQNSPTYYPYNPPPPDLDRQVAYQVFLI